MYLLEGSNFRVFNKLIELKLSKNQQQIINIVAGVLNMLITTLIGFVLSPYVTKTIGVEASGFINLASNFISYAVLARTALNSMGSRFLMMAYYNNEHEKFKKLYSSLFFADLVLALIFGVVCSICVWKLEFILVIPTNLINDVKLLFAVLFLNFIISTAFTVWSTATYIKNKLYLDSITSAAASIIRFLMIVGLFLCLNPNVCFVGVGTLISGIITVIIHFVFKIRLFPGLTAERKMFSWCAIKELVSSGIWNTLSSLGVMLASGIDLLVANIFIGPSLMGVLAIAKTMPSFVDTLNYTIASVFTPSLIIDYAKSDKSGIVKNINNSSKLISIVCTLPLGFLIVYGKEFYSLWQPTQNAELLHILSIITIAGRIFFTGMQPLFNVFTVTNKVKQNAIVNIINGALSVIIVYILLKTTSLGIYAIAAVSVVCSFFKNILFVIPFSAKYLGFKKISFYSTLIPSISCSIILCAFGFIERFFIKVDSWLSLICAGIIFVVVGVCLTTIIVLNKSERKIFWSTLLKKVKR